MDPLSSHVATQVLFWASGSIDGPPENAVIVSLYRAQGDICSGELGRPPEVSVAIGYGV